jgi:beta-glucanase (GH16 family)
LRKASVHECRSGGKTGDGTQAMRLELLRFCLLATLLASHASYAAPDLAGMKLIFDDEFDGPELDRSKWQLGTEPNGSQWGSSAYFVPIEQMELLPKVYIQSDGILKLRANYDTNFKDPVPWDQKWYSGLIATAFSDGRPPSGAFRRGCVEVRQKLPAGRGVWPGNWALNMLSMSKSGDPLGPLEIDGLEEYGYNANRFHTGLIDWSNHDTATNNVGTWIDTPDLSADFHIYDYCLSATTMTVFFDGAQKASLPLYRPDTMGKVFWMFNLAMGSGWPIDIPLAGYYEMQIDYVRIWSADPDAVAITPDPK